MHFVLQSAYLANYVISYFCQGIKQLTIFVYKNKMNMETDESFMWGIANVSRIYDGY